MEVDFGEAMFGNCKSLFVSYPFKTPQNMHVVKLKNSFNFHYKIHYAKAKLKGSNVSTLSGTRSMLFPPTPLLGR